MLRKRVFRIVGLILFVLLVTLTTQSIKAPMNVYLVYDYEEAMGRTWCTIESLCRAGVTPIVLTRNPLLFNKFPDCQGKLKTQILDYDALFQGTDFQEWYESPENRNSSLWKYDLVDAARWALVYKYGGTYSDLDIIYFKPTIFSYNRVAAQHSDSSHGHYLNGNFLSFKRNHRFVRRAIRKFVSAYRPDHDWGATGPGILTSTWNECKSENGNDCKHIELLDANKLQLIRPGTLRQTLELQSHDPIAKSVLERLMSESYGLHFSNSEIGSEKFPFGSVFHILYTQYCPKVSDLFTNTLFQ